MLLWEVIVSLIGSSLLSVANQSIEVPLTNDLEEISGWVFLNDSTLVAHNDSGDEACLYLIGTDGILREKVALPGIKNVDFEDIATDGQSFVYLGDFGNNANNRKDLVIYKIRKDELIAGQVTSVPEAIRFSYAEQEAFPPSKNQLHFDAEAMVYDRDSLFIFTKCRAKPFDGAAYVYGLPATPGTYKPKRLATLHTGKRGWLFDSVTAADLKDDRLYLLTYSKVWIYSVASGHQYKLVKKLKTGVSQKEALAVGPEGKLFIGDEKRHFSGGKLHIINPEKKKKK